MWQGIKSITDYKNNSACLSDDVALSNDLNTFFARFDVGNSTRSTTITVAEDLGLGSLLCNWILNFFSERSQVVRLGTQLSSTVTLSTGMPQGCVLSPILYSLFTHDCAPASSDNIVKFADDTTVIGLITNNNESAYRGEIENLVSWCSRNNLTLNSEKTKELIINFGRTQQLEFAPVFINGDRVERVSNFKFLGTFISEDITWSTNVMALVKKAQQRLFFLRTLRKACLNRC